MNNNFLSVNKIIFFFFRLNKAGIPVRYCTNETTCTKNQIVSKLKNYGFDIELSMVFSPIPAVCAILKERNLRPFLLVSPGKKINCKI